MAAELAKVGYKLAYPERRATHEFILTLSREAREHGVTAMDVANACLITDITHRRRTFPC